MARLSPEFRACRDPRQSLPPCPLAYRAFCKPKPPFHNGPLDRLHYTLTAGVTQPTFEGCTLLQRQRAAEAATAQASLTIPQACC